MELTSLKKIYNRCSEYVRYVDEGRWMEQRDDVSEFWAEVFQIRRNYTKFNDMLVMRRGATHPLGDSESNIAQGVEYQKARAAYFVVSQSVPETYFGNLNESVIGSPMSFDFNGQMFSTGGIINALTSYRIVKWCKSKGLVNRPLRILEIGAGYGGVAYQLFQQLKIKSYTICDLPENLFLSAFYLQANFPDQKAIFVGENGAVQSEESKFIFLVPPFLNKLSGPFDLVINSYSFQEMNLASVNEYFAFVETKLETDGLFYSLNAHRKDEVAWPSDYPVEKFRMISLEPVRKYPHHYVFATNPYEVVMTKRTEPLRCAEALTRFKRQFDALGVALQLGLHDELLEMCQKFSQAELELEP